jgi:hypothetical protein
MRGKALMYLFMALVAFSILTKVIGRVYDSLHTRSYEELRTQAAVLADSTYGKLPVWDQLAIIKEFQQHPTQNLTLKGCPAVYAARDPFSVCGRKECSFLLRCSDTGSGYAIVIYPGEGDPDWRCIGPGGVGGRPGNYQMVLLDMRVGKIVDMYTYREGCNPTGSGMKDAIEKWMSARGVH